MYEAVSTINPASHAVSTVDAASVPAVMSTVDALCPPPCSLSMLCVRC